MGYAVYLIEDLSNTTNYTELDIEDVDFGTTFLVSDVEDISTRKDNMTKQLVFKGTKKNNMAFGAMFRVDRNTDIDTLQNKLFFNYNPLRTVDCLIYEDNMLILRGTMRVHEITIKDGIPYYATVVTGACIDLKVAIADKYLHDLDLTDLRHHWAPTQILQSQQTQTERYDPATGTFSNVPFSKGSGYVYPFIDYGNSFENPDYNQQRHTKYVHMNNMRPAIYLKEYLDRIFKQDVLKGYSYEVRASNSEDIEKFNSLIVPNNVENMTERNSTKNFRMYNDNAMQTDHHGGTEFPFISGNPGFYGDFNHYEIPIQLNHGLFPGPVLSANLVNYYGNYNGNTKAVMNVEKNFTTDGLIRVKFENLQSQLSGFTFVMKFHVQLVERDFIQASSGDFKKQDTWKVVSDSYFNLPVGAPITREVQFDIGEHKFLKGKQIMLRVDLEVTNSNFVHLLIVGNQRPVFFKISANQAELSLPKNQITGTMLHDVTSGDVITPTAPENVKQMDFIKSILAAHNYYAYTERDRPKHIIFESYNDFYALTSPNVLPSVALDWTKKVNYKSDVKIVSNLNLPKKYLFTYKQDDADYFNKSYKTQTTEVYGQFAFNDALGITDQKKVELIFSPSPTVEYPGTLRLHPSYWVYETSNGSQVPKPVKTNLRLLYYSGLKKCTEYALAVDKYNYSTSAWETDILSPGNQFYACATEYYYRAGVDNMLPVDSLQFGQPQETFFGINSSYLNGNLTNIYFGKYMTQVSQLTDPNVVFVECDMFLNEIDIANLDLRVPVFIDMGDNGHAYFKVLAVQYDNKYTVSKVKLQKITL